MNSEKSLGLGLGCNGSSTTAAGRQEIDIQKNLGDQATFDYLSTKNSGVATDARRVNRKLEHDEIEQQKKLHRGSKQFGKQSVDYDDTEFLQKMFSNVDSDIRNLSKNNNVGGHQSSIKSYPSVTLSSLNGIYFYPRWGFIKAQSVMDFFFQCMY